MTWQQTRNQTINENNDSNYCEPGGGNSGNSHNDDSANYSAKLSSSILEQHVQAKVASAWETAEKLSISQLRKSIENIKIPKIELLTIHNQLSSRLSFTK